jgi:hypothetical protein
MMIQPISEVKWFDPKNTLPQIPEKYFGISVMLILYDEVYAEHKGKEHGYSVHDAIYMPNKRKNGELHEQHLDPDGVYFFEAYTNGRGDKSFHLPVDEVIAWAYVPKVPQSLIAEHQLTRKLT